MKKSIIYVNVYNSSDLLAAHLATLFNTVAGSFIEMTLDGHLMWRACAQWLCGLEVLPANHRVMMPDATFQDLAFTLRDGVLLCHIASSLDEASIKPKAVNHRPQMAQFLCLKNIRLFLAACKSSFGLKESDLFDPSMLYDFTDFAKVLHTLSELSKSPKVRSIRPHVLPWPQEDQQHEEVEEEDVIYSKLEAEADEGTYQEFYYKHTSNYGYVWDGKANRRRNCYAYLQYYVDEEKEEEIYADLGLVKRPRDHKAQSAVGRLEDWKFEPKEKRDFCLLELLETEANYVDVLNRLRKNFIKPITTIKESDKKIIFMNIKEVHI